MTLHRQEDLMSHIPLGTRLDNLTDGTREGRASDLSIIGPNVESTLTRLSRHIFDSVATDILTMDLRLYEDTLRVTRGDVGVAWFPVDTYDLKYEASSLAYHASFEHGFILRLDVAAFRVHLQAGSR